MRINIYWRQEPCLINTGRIDICLTRRSPSLNIVKCSLNELLEYLSSLFIYFFYAESLANMLFIKEIKITHNQTT